MCYFQVSELEDIDRRWAEFYQNLETFSSWLNEKENDLNNIPNMGGSPEEQFNQTKVGGLFPHCLIEQVTRRIRCVASLAVVTEMCSSKIPGTLHNSRVLLTSE